MKRSLLIFAALAAWTACAQSARLGALGRNDMVVTNTVHQSLAPSTNYTDAATNALAHGMAKADRITDGTNTIDAARNVYTNAVLRSSEWVVSQVDGYSFTGPFYSSGDWVIDYEAGGGVATGTLSTNGPADAVELTFTDPEYGLVVHATRPITGIVSVAYGKLALTNDIDYTTSNAQLVSTIEATAPAPGNYSAVSNAAMNARNATDLGVRGEPQGEGSWFTFNGHIVSWDAESESWCGQNINIDDYDGHYIFFWEVGETVFYLDENFSCSINSGTNTYIIIGYTNTLAQVSQIPVVPSGIVTTNDNGELFMYGTNVVPLVFGAAQRTEISVMSTTSR